MSGLITPIDSLPNEILIAILSTFESRELLPVTLVDRRFNATATTILQHRLLYTAKMEGHEVVLESYHPSAKLTTPSMSCRFMGVDFLNRTWTGDEDLDLRDLRQLYSHFRPVVSEETRRMRRMYTRRVPGAPAPPEDTGDDEPVIQEICLDEGELFSQLCTTTSLIKTGPRPGIFASHSNIEDGVVRVWRHWLERVAAKCAIAPAGEQQRDESTILWADARKNVGLRFRVTQIAQEQAPVLHSRDEDPPVTYSLRYEELLVRTSQVLLAMEKSAVQEIVDSGNAIVIASY
ncbi:F-box domain-containing protein [Colletotrichum karsti]|uniref:F-box domain-containing protein n=1 Tax=Colletotrichum karsti TaxID=1095194 RepID=A0A9P6HYB6_9PEZI|nr:F-box domain-containing protein [Colletotrichum karsti]KAF9872405.1 F-box domain-containing protein [Colletotrichum karsti]